MALHAQEGENPGRASDVLRGTSGHKISNNIYIVQMADSPVVAYKGGVSGLQATRPARGQKIDPNSPQVLAYVSYLQSRHDRALGAAGGGRKVADYVYTFNGFAAELTALQAEAIKSAEGVVTVTKDELRDAETATTPAFLGLTAPGGIWEQLGGVGAAGENIIIGIVDSGIWPESLSFSDRTGSNGNASKDGKLSYTHVPLWHGQCRPGDQFTATLCNQKLIGAYHFNAGFGGDAAIKSLFPYEYASPRDYNGHGTHTASTAGGNSGVALSGALSVFGAVSGIAPRARIAMYKALWHNQATGTASGFNSDLVAAIDRAVADGVDVINYSISGSRTNFVDPVEVAFLNAADAGVFVAASAGNSGPTTSTVAHPSPWITTVAASTHPRNGYNSATVAGTTYQGNSYTLNAVSGVLVDATTSGLPGTTTAMASLCYAANNNLVNGVATPVLDPAKVAGKIVLCDRGTIALVDKSRAVLEAGGIGMILTNVANSGAPLALIHSVPTTHLPYTAANYAALHSAAQAGVNASISASEIRNTDPAPFTAGFSSRGPMLAGSGNQLKPDIIAPGVDILAAVAPPGNGGNSFASYQGTSMSSPHIAGIAALFKSLHPRWTPMMIKSALMTSAGNVLDTSNTNNALLIFRQGAGHVAPNAAMNPGLVYDSNANDWLAFLCGSTTAVRPATCASLTGAGYSTVASDLNTPSIAIGAMAGSQTVTRRVTNVGSSTATYTASFTGMTGLDVTVTPSSLQIAPGQTKSFTVTFVRNTTALPTGTAGYTGGQLTWATSGGPGVRIPMVVRPVTLAAPAQVTGNGADITYNVKFGYTGTFGASAFGLVPAARETKSVTDDPTNTFSLTGAGVTKMGEFAVAAGTSHLRFSLFDTDVSAPADIDLYVYRRNTDGTETLVAATGGATSNEEANLVNPAAATYIVYAHGYEVSGTVSATLFSWIVPNTSAGNMSITAPTSATVGANGTITLSFPGLAANRWLGSVAYSGTTGMPSPTLVYVNNE